MPRLVSNYPAPLTLQLQKRAVHLQPGATETITAEEAQAPDVVRLARKEFVRVFADEPKK